MLTTMLWTFQRFDRYRRVYLWRGVCPNLPDKQLPVSAQAEKAVPKDQQLQDSSCMPLVAPMPSQKWTDHNHPL